MGAVPVATTLKVAAWPLFTLWLEGWVVIRGADTSDEDDEDDDVAVEPEPQEAQIQRATNATATAAYLRANARVARSMPANCRVITLNRRE